MSLSTLERLMPRLACPRCRSALARDAQGWSCSNVRCDDGAPRRFPIVSEHPVLVDFSASILDRESLVTRSGASAVPRSRLGSKLAWSRRLLTPPNRAAARHAAAILERLGHRTTPPTLLIVGGGTVGNGAEALYEDAHSVEVVAFDLYASPRTQFIADAHAIPLADGSVDAVWIQAVLEHVLDPARVVTEIERVLRPEGVVYAETPFMQQVHEGPYDFTRFSESGHRWLFRRFECLDSGVVAGPGNQLTWSVAALVAGLFRSRAAGRISRVLTVWAQALDHWIPMSYASDGASCVFFFGRKWERELTPHEIVEFYRGAQGVGGSPSRR
jgi:SAM-dependent methyltransferase